MYPTETLKYYEFEYTTVIYLKDPLIRILDCKIEYNGNYKEFLEELEDWNRQGQAMKQRRTLSNIAGYDYYLTSLQDRRNKTAKLQRKEVIPWEYYLNRVFDAI